MNLIFYLLILFLPSQLGRHFFLDFSFVSGVRVDYLAPTVYLTDILVLLLFIAWVIKVCHRDTPVGGVAISLGLLRRSLRSLLAMTTHLKYLKLVALVVFVAFIFFGITFSKSPPAGLYGLLKFLEFVFLGFYTAFNIRKLRFDTVLFLFSAGIIFESILAIAQFLNQGSIGGIFYFFGERALNGQTPGIANASIAGELILRPYSTFPHPNVLAGYLIIALAMVISNFQFPISNFKKIIFLVSLAVGTIALFLTMSRVAIILWLFIVGLRLIVSDWQTAISGLLGRHSGKPVSRRAHPESPRVKSDSGQARMTDKDMGQANFKLKIIIAIFIGAILLISPLRSRFTNIRLSDESITQRGELIKDSFSMIKSYPIFGVGLNNFLVELPSVHKQDANVFYLQPVHNIYLLVLSQTGIVGFAFFIWFVFKTFKNLKIKNSFQISNFKFQILSTVLVLGLFDHYFLTLQQGQLLFSFILGLCWAKDLT